MPFKKPQDIVSVVLTALAGLTVVGLLTLTGNQTISGTLTVSGSNTSTTALVVNATNTQALAIRTGNGNNIFTVNTSSGLAIMSSTSPFPVSNLLQIQNSSDTSRYLTVSSTATISHADIEAKESIYFDAEIDDGNSGTSDTIDWSLGNKHKSTVTGDVVYTFTAPAGPTSVTLKVVNGGSQNPSWPATVKWPAATEPTWTAAGTDLVNCYYDGTSYFCGAVLDLS